MASSRRPAILDLLPRGYQRLFDRAVEVLEADERVRGLWLSGSLARGTADRASDLDLLVAVADDAHQRFADAWKDWLGAITPTLIARPLPFAPGSFFSVTTGWERLDVVVEPVHWLTDTLFRSRLTVFDRDGLDALIPPPDPVPGPSPAKVAGLVEEFFRDYGMFDTVIVREDWLLGMEAVHFLRNLLYQLFVELNAPLPMMGIKQWSAKLTPDQRALLESCPAVRAERSSVLHAHEVAAVAFVRAARTACADLGVAWPEELEAATVRHLESCGLPALSLLDPSS